MSDLDEIYARLAHAWPQEELAAHYRSAEDRGARVSTRGRRDIDRAVQMAATAFPTTATLGVAVYVLHLLRGGIQDDLAQRLIENAHRNAASALHHCHRALRLDAAARGYTPEQWMPTICDAAARLLNSARLQQEPPTVVREAQDAISWLSRSVIELDKESAEAANTLSEVLGRLLAVWIFAQTAHDLAHTS